MCQYSLEVVQKVCSGLETVVCSFLCVCFLWLRYISRSFNDGFCRYNMSGKVMPSLRSYIETTLGVDIEYRTPSQLRSDFAVPVPVDNQLFIEFLRANEISYSNAAQHRLIRSHGHTGLHWFDDFETTIVGVQILAHCKRLQVSFLTNKFVFYLLY